MKLSPQLAAKLRSLKRSRNPVPPSSIAKLRKGSQLYEDFTGHRSEYVDTLKKPHIPDVLVKIGSIDGILYTTVRDGKTESYIHEFKGRAKPTFTVSDDGKQIILLGGRYTFTERGIVDNT